MGEGDLQNHPHSFFYGVEFFSLYSIKYLLSAPEPAAAERYAKEAFSSL